MHNIPNISEGLWEDMKVILEYITIKNLAVAEELDTVEYKHNAHLYFTALHERGTITLYADYLSFDLLSSVMFLESGQFINDCLNIPIKIPTKYHNTLLHKIYPKVLAGFEEKNEYYRMLTGKPPYGTKEADFIFLNDFTYIEYGIQKVNVNGVKRYPAIHEMSSILQDIVTKSANFQEILAAHPEAEYLGYLGQHSIPLEQARAAKEFEIIRLFPSIDPNVNMDLAVHFSSEYNKVRNWTTKVMWNADLEQSSIAYRQYVGFAILIKALRLTLNRQFDGIIENSFLNDKLVAILFDLYRLPQSLNNLPRENRRRLALELRKLIRNRAGNEVLYDIARILGFDNIIISKIVLNKIQLFESDAAGGAPIHATLTDVPEPISGQLRPVDDPYHSFVRQTQAIDLKSKNPHDDIINQTHIKHYVREVTEPDPRWWEDNDQTTDSGIYPQTPDGFLNNDLDEIKKKEFNPQMFKTPTFGNQSGTDYDVQVSEEHQDYDELYWKTSEEVRQHPTHWLPGYNSVDTKYLMLTYHYSMAERTFEAIYLMRFLLDKQRETETYKFTLPTYGGPVDHTLYDIVLFLVCGLNKLMFNPQNDAGIEPYKLNKYGQIINNDTGYHRILGFNLDLTDKEINDYLARCEYLDPTLIRSFIAQTTLSKRSDIKSAWAVGILGLRDYLVTQMEMADNIVHWREAEKFYNMMFTYDPVRDIHATPALPANPDDEYIVPMIRYRIFDMEVSDFGDMSGKVGDEVKITLESSLVNITKSHTIICGVVGEVESNVNPTLGGGWTKVSGSMTNNTATYRHTPGSTNVLSYPIKRTGYEEEITVTFLCEGANTTNNFNIVLATTPTGTTGTILGSNVRQPGTVTVNADSANSRKYLNIVPDSNFNGTFTLTCRVMSPTDDTPGTSGLINKVNFHYRNPAYTGSGADHLNTAYIYEDYNLLPYWNRTQDAQGTWNSIDDVKLISDFTFDKGDLYNPSGNNGPDIHPGSYQATIGNSSSSMYIRVTASRYHTKELYEYYLEELLARDSLLGSFVNGEKTDKEMAEIMSEACDVLSEAIDVDLNFLRSEIHGGEDMEIYLMDMIKYIKSYTIDFITSEKKFVLNDKKNPEWLRMIDQVVFDPKKPTTLTAIDILMIFDAARHVESHVKIFDGKNLPKNEWDNDVFDSAPPKMVDSIKIYRDEDRPGIQYFYMIREVIIEEFTLPEGIEQGTKFEDIITVENSSGEPPTEVFVEIYVGYNPTPGEGMLADYQDSGFMYHTIETSWNDLPILIKFHHNNLPISLPVDMVPIWGVIKSSLNGYFIGQVHCDYVRRDINNPQYIGVS